MFCTCRINISRTRVASCSLCTYVSWLSRPSRARWLSSQKQQAWNQWLFLTRLLLVAFVATKPDILSQKQDRSLTVTKWFYASMSQNQVVFWGKKYLEIFPDVSLETKTGYFWSWTISIQYHGNQNRYSKPNPDVFLTLNRFCCD